MPNLFLEVNANASRIMNWTLMANVLLRKRNKYITLLLVFLLLLQSSWSSTRRVSRLHPPDIRCSWRKQVVSCDVSGAVCSSWRVLLHPAEWFWTVSNPRYYQHPNSTDRQIEISIQQSPRHLRPCTTSDRGRDWWAGTTASTKRCIWEPEIIRVDNRTTTYHWYMVQVWWTVLNLVQRLSQDVKRQRWMNMELEGV